MSEQLFRAFWNSSERGLLELGVIKREPPAIEPQAEKEQRQTTPRTAELFTEGEFEILQMHFEKSCLDSDELILEPDLTAVDPYTSVEEDGEIVVRIEASGLHIIGVKLSAT